MIFLKSFYYSHTLLHKSYLSHFQNLNLDKIGGCDMSGNNQYFSPKQMETAQLSISEMKKICQINELNFGFKSS